MISYCTACQRIFDSVAAYRKHRTGRFMPNTRRCRTEAEMLRVYLFRNENVWHLKTPLELIQEEFHTEKAQAFQARS